MLGKTEIAEEITQDVFLRLWIKKDSINPVYSISPLLFKMTKDFSWNYLKKQSKAAALQERYITDIEPTTSSTVESELIFNDFLNVTEDAFKMLPPSRQSVFKLHYKKGMENSEIAKVKNISESTVRVHLMKASNYLRMYIHSHPEILIILFFLSQKGMQFRNIQHSDTIISLIVFL